MREINNRIKKLRERLGETQDSFGKAIGLSKSGISNLENGSRNVTEKHIKLIVNTFDVREEWLRNGEGDIFNISNKTLDVILKQNNLNDIDKKIIIEFAKLKPVQRQVFRDCLKKIFYNTSSDYTLEDEKKVKDINTNVSIEKDKHYDLTEKLSSMDRTKVDISKLPEDIQNNIILAITESEEAITTEKENVRKMA